MTAERLVAVALLCAAMSSTVFAVFSAAPAPVPEPTTTALLGAGALLLGGVRYLRKRRARK
jgi:hypothetical protein